MWLGSGLVSVLVAVLSIGAGWVVARRALGERSLPIAAGLSLAFAVVGQGIGLLWLPRIMPVGWAAFVTALAMAAAALAVNARFKSRDSNAALTHLPARRGARYAWALIALVSALVYVSSLAHWFDGSAGRADVATLFLHSGLTSTISRGNFPVTNIYEPDFPMSYRFSFHTLAASANHLTGLGVERLLPHVVAALSVVLFLTAAAVVGRVSGGLKTGVVGGALLWASGPLYWTGAPGLAATEGWPDVLASIRWGPESVTWSGVTLGPTYTMATHNPTNLFGLIPALVSLLLVHELISRRHDGGSLWLISLLLGACLTLLAAASEYFYPAVLAGSIAVVIYRLLRKKGTEMRVVAVLAAATVGSGILSLTTSSVIGTVIRGDRDLMRLGVYFNGANAGKFSSWGYNSGGPFFEWPNTGQHEVNAFSLEFLIDGGFPMYLLIPVVIWIALRPMSRAAPFAITSAAAFAAATLFHFQHSPPDIYRFAYFGTVTAVIAVAIWAAPALKSRVFSVRFAARAGATVTSAALVGGFAVSALAWPQMIGQAEARPERAEAAAIEFLKTTDVSDRLLILWGSRTAFDLYDPATPQVSAHIAAYTGQFIPYGYHHLSKAEQYSRIYGWAQEALAPEHLRTLQIKYIYVDPSRLTEAQRNGLDSLLGAGKLETVMDDRQPDGTVRIMYEYRPKPG